MSRKISTLAVVLCACAVLVDGELPDAGELWDDVNVTDCRLEAIDVGMKQRVVDILARKAKLIEYHLTVVNYSGGNPLTAGARWMYKADVWSRVGTSHGHTILNLAFNYGVLSLMTLTLGVQAVGVRLRDSPPGCLAGRTERAKTGAVLRLLLRDLDADGPVTVWDGESTVCHQLIAEVRRSARFTDRCCYRRRDAPASTACFTGLPNRWLAILDQLLAALHCAIFIFGPFALPGWMYSAADDTRDYVVELREPLACTLCISRADTVSGVSARHTLDVRGCKRFERCRRLARELPAGVVIPVRVSRYDVHVNYRRLLCEDRVPVSLVECLARALFLCKLRELDAFADCCDADMLGCWRRRARPLRWIGCCNYFGRALLVLFVPLPYYVRLGIYYAFEHPEMVARRDAAAALRLPVHFSHRLLQSLTPTHPLFIAAYCVFLASGLTVAYFSGRQRSTRFQQSVIASFVDLQDLSMLKAIGMVVANLLWPFKRFGVWGCFIGLIYWPLIMPISVIACVIYCLPVVFVTCRLLRHTFIARPAGDDGLPPSHGVHAFAADVLLRTLETPTAACGVSARLPGALVKGAATLAALLTLYSVLLLVTEVVGFAAEVLCFTMMGIIVNASKVLKYGSLIFLVIVYSYDCYNNVNKKYVKLNKALFAEVKDRLGDCIDRFTSLPAHLQGDRGFKSCEASEQADYESADDVAVGRALHWHINDLILFVDRDDRPRIPKQLFEEVCQIRVAGSPGPVYRSYLQATGRFLTIVCFLVFVFLVVLSFGDNYKISSTNQMLATMAGGFMPFIFTSLLKPASAEIETNLVSFRSKLEEIIINFHQTWPMSDFQFDIDVPPPPPPPLAEDETGGEKRNAADEKINKIGAEDDGTRPGIQSSSNMTNDCIEDMKAQCEEMDLDAADGKCVDILLLVSETDSEWDIEWSYECESNNVDVKANGVNTTVVKII